MKKTKLTRDIESNNEKQNTVLYSELSPLGYDDSYLAWYVRYIFDNFDDLKKLDSSELHIYLEKIFNDFLSILDTDKSLSQTISFSREKYLEFIELSKINYDIKKFDMCNRNYDGSISVNLADRISELYDFLKASPVNSYPVYQYCLFKSLIENFFKLSAECIFNIDNPSINSLPFRTSKTLESLYCMGKIPFENSDMKRKKGYAYYNICSPFVAEPFLRTVVTLEKFVKSNRLEGLKVIPELKQLYTEIFINEMNRSFMRFTSYNGRYNNYRVTLNRHNSELISVPYNELSSLENVKPLHLFEKIIFHLYHRLKDNNTNDYTDILRVNIGVIGHTEVSYSNAYGDLSIGEYREIYDLLRMVVNWYTRIADFGKIKVPKLELTISYFVNEGDVLCSRSLDIPDDKETSEAFTGEYKEGCNEGRFYVKTCSYFSEFTFVKRNLLDLINQNDVMFILDCPWLTVESYELKNEGLMDFYCSAIEKKATTNDSLWENMYSNYIRSVSNIIKELDTNYNRITSSDTIKSGPICRVFADDILRTLEKYTRLEKSDSSRKDVYIYTSEKDGVDYSYIASYPTKNDMEYLDGKYFTIAHFSNRKLETLDLANDGEELCFHIRLWTLFRYIAVSYVSVYFRKEIDQIFSGYSLSPEDYFELVRAIIVKLKVSYDLNTVDISIGYDENILKSLNIKKIALDKLHEHLKPFIKALFKDVIFSDDKSFQSYTIKNAFKTSIIDDAKNVESMLFYYFYKERYRKSCVSSFDVKLNFEKYEYFNNIDDFNDFKDKDLYLALFSNLIRHNELNIGTIHSLHIANDIFECKGDRRKALVKNIIEACKKTGYTKNRMYKNALDYLNNFGRL